MWTVAPEPLESPVSEALLRDYFADIIARYFRRPIDPQEVEDAMEEYRLAGLAAFLVARWDGEPAGCAGLRKDGAVTRMYIARPYRRRGGARLLLRGLEAAAREQGFSAAAARHARGPGRGAGAVPGRGLRRGGALEGRGVRGPLLREAPHVRTVGRYEVLRTLGRGGMATVHLARQPELDRLVALKEMHAFHTDQDAILQRFVRESRLAGSLSHPNIVTVYDFLEVDDTPYIAMEYVEAGSLRPYLPVLSDAQRLFVLHGILAGLVHAEEHGVVHRDLKPENVLVSAGGDVKITDFGVAKATRSASTALTGVGMTVGTPGYMAPEQAMAQPIGPWTDLYAVGCMAYELFAGAVPFADPKARWRSSCAT